MSQATQTARGDFALGLLRLCLLGTVSTLVGVLGHVAWRAITQA